MGRKSVISVTSKGQVTIPVEIRKALGIEPRDRVAFELTDGVATVKKVESVVDKWAGSIRPRKRPEDFKELRRIAIQEVVANALRETEE